jgi:hypothetical protein
MYFLYLVYLAIFLWLGFLFYSKKGKEKENNILRNVHVVCPDHEDNDKEHEICGKDLRFLAERRYNGGRGGFYLDQTFITKDNVFVIISHEMSFSVYPHNRNVHVVSRKNAASNFRDDPALYKKIMSADVS